MDACAGHLNVAGWPTVRPPRARQHGKQRVQFYACVAHWKRGPEVCGNGLVGRMEAIDAEVLATLRDDILRPSIVERAVALALEEWNPRRAGERQAAADTELRAIDAEHAGRDGGHHARR
jgi:hypothetical protein